MGHSAAVRKGRRFWFSKGSRLKASTPLEERILDLIEPTAADLGLVMVRVRISGMRRKRLQIMAERACDGGMGVGNCEALSRAIGPVLDVADLIAGEYDLEVSSPGIDRPLVRLEDFTKFVGHEAKMETAAMIDGRRRYRGEIVGVESGDVVIAIDGAPMRVPFTALSDARLVLTEKLIEEDLKRAELAETEAEED
jgi:ribosome maturation factor RimP